MLATTLSIRRLVPSRVSYGYYLGQRFQSSKKNEEKPKNTDVSSTNTNEVSSFNIKPTTSSAAPAQMDGNLAVEKLMKKDNKPYIPRLKHERLTYEYPGLPNVDESHSNTTKPKVVNRWSRYVPKILTAIVLVWAGYTIKVWVFPPEDGADSNELLAPHQFHSFVITHKQQIDDDHYLIEIMPKFKQWQYSYYAHYEQKSIWNGDKIWSVDVMHPDIMVVRAYTPLPLYYMKSQYTRSGEKEPLLRVVNNDGDDYDKGGVMCLYVKKYNDGEVSRYIVNKEIGDELQLRGPNIEYKFPYHPIKKFHERPIFRDLPSKVEAETGVDKIYRRNKLPSFDNLNFYTAGTGIAPALQVLLSKNPYRGFINLHYSAQKPGEIKPLERFLFFLEKLDRVKVHYHYDSQKKTMLSAKDFKPPVPSDYLSPQKIEQIESNLTEEEALKLRLQILNSDKDTIESEEEVDNVRGPRFENALEQAKVTSQEPKKDASLSIVCGPDGYVSYIAGNKLAVTNEQGPIAGKLGEKNWSNANTFKL